jgi:hypothetical protein
VLSLRGDIPICKICLQVAFDALKNDVIKQAEMLVEWIQGMDDEKFGKWLRREF